MLTKKFFEKLRSTGKNLYDVAWEAGLHPATVYKINRGIDRPDPGDPRIIKLCSYLGLPVEEAFESPEVIK